MRFWSPMQKYVYLRTRKSKKVKPPLTHHTQDLPIRQFLLTNLRKLPDASHMQFRIPVRILAAALDDMADFPFSNPDEARFNKRALFIRGTKSHYVSDETIPIIGRFFPRFELVDVDSGHWVISEKPEAFRKGESCRCGIYMFGFADGVCSCCGVFDGGGIAVEYGSCKYKCTIQFSLKCAMFPISFRLAPCW